MAGVVAGAAVALWAATPVRPDDPKPALPPAGVPPTVPTMSNLSLVSCVLMPPLAIGGESVSIVRVKGLLPGAGSVELDPNPIVVDRFGQIDKRGLRAFSPRTVELVAMAESAAPPEGVVGGRWRLFELRPAKEWGGGVALHLSIGDGACGPHRLLVLDAAGKVTRIVTMEVER